MSKGMAMNTTIVSIALRIMVILFLISIKFMYLSDDSKLTD